MNDSHWAALGLTESVLAKLYQHARQYAANRVSLDHREDAVQNGMCRVLYAVTNYPESIPDNPEDRLKYLVTCLTAEILAMAPQDQLGPTPRLPRIPTDAIKT